MQLSRGVKRFLLGSGIALGLILMVLMGLSLLVRLPFIQAEIRSRIESNLQARFNIEVAIGSAYLDPLLRSVKISQLRISRHEQPQRDASVEIEGVELYPNLWSLLRLRFQLNRVLLSRPRVSIQPSKVATARNKEISFTVKSLALPLGIERFLIQDGEVLWEETGKRITMSGLQGEFRAQTRDVEGSLRIAEIKIETGHLSLSVTDLALRGELQGDNFQVNQIRLTALGSVMEGQGQIRSILNDPAINLAINASGEIEDLFPRKPPVRLLGTFHLEGGISGPIMDPTFTGQAKIKHGKLGQFSTSSINMVVEGNRSEFRLKQLEMRGVDGTLTGDLTVTWKSLQYRLSLLGKRVNLTRILRLVAGNAYVGGHTTMEAQVVGQGTDLSKLKGQIKIGVEDFHFLKRPEERGHVRISLEGQGTRVQVRKLEVAIAQTHLSAAGTLEPGENLTMSVVGQTAKLDQIAGLFGSKPHQLAGEVKFKGQLSGPLGDPVLKGDLHWSNATLLGVTLASVRGPVELSLAQRTLKSPSLDAMRQDLRGKFNVGLTLLPKPPHRKLKLKQDLELKIDGDIEGPWEQLIGIFFKKQLPITGNMQLQVDIQGTPENLSGQGRLGVTDFTVFEMPWERAQATVRLKERRILLQGIEIQNADEKITGRSELGFDGHIRGNLSSTPISIQRVARLRRAGFTGTATILSVKSEGAVGQENLSARVEFDHLAYGSSSFGSGQGTFNWDRPKRQLTGRINLPDRGYTLRGDLLTETNFPYKGTITLAKGDLVSLLRIVKDRLPAQLSGVGTGEINLSGYLGEETPDLVTVDLGSAGLEIQGYSFQTAGKIELTFKEGQLTIPPVTLKGEGASIVLGGTIGKEMNLTIRGNAPTVLASIVSPEISAAKGITNLDLSIQGPRAMPRYRGHIATTDSSLTLRGHPEPIEKLQGEIRFTQSTAESHGLEAHWGGGKLRATLQGKREQNGWKWPIEFSLTDARVERILVTKTDKELPGLATGELQANGTLNFTTGPDLEWLSSLKGKVNLKAVHGNILRSFVLERILTAINVTGLFHKGPGGKGMAYDEMSAVFHLDKGIAKTENLRLRSPSLSAGGTGQLDLVKRTCDAHIAVQPLQLTDRVVRAASNLPLVRHLGVGSFLFGKDQSILVVAYHVHGPLAKLQLDHIPTRGIQGGVLGVFEQTLGLPANLFMRGGNELEEDLGPQRQNGESDNSP